MRLEPATSPPVRDLTPPKTIDCKLQLTYTFLLQFFAEFGRRFQGFSKNFVELHNIRVWGTEVQRDPRSDPRYLRTKLKQFFFSGANRIVESKLFPDYEYYECYMPISQLYNSVFRIPQFHSELHSLCSLCRKLWIISNRLRPM